MNLQAAIFDMDGLLIDSEPLWQIAGKATLASFGHELSTEQYHSSTGLRTEEWIEHWFHFFQVDMAHAPAAVDTITSKAIELIDQHGQPLPGVTETLELFRSLQFRIGLATSSPLELVQVVINKLGLHGQFDAITSAQHLPFGKPNPQVYIDCADALQVPPMNCVAFEDSFNGMIAAKAARMKCVVVPAADHFHLPKWNAADLKLNSLADFQAAHLSAL